MKENKFIKLRIVELNRIKYAFFTIYILILFKLTLFRQTTLENCETNFTLFVDFINVYKKSGLWQFIRLFFGNIVWFVPFGFMLPMMLKKYNFITVAFSGFLFSLFIEILQLVLKKGIFEIDDLILNVFGTMIGYSAYKIIQRINATLR
ncbi:MAG: VanZ family protein [Clostridia bacterium]|nr:VanZ family protein [Clostridia bacterium]